MKDENRKAMHANKTMKEITSEIWESKGADNIYGKKMMVVIDRHTGNEETWVLQNKEKDKAWILNDKGESERDQSESYGANGFRRATWKERKLAEQDNSDLD